jgi:ribosomal protein S18 acetylase RimI-like enzyme
MTTRIFRATSASIGTVTGTVVVIRRARPEDDVALRAIDTATWSAENNPGPPVPPDAPFFTATSAVEDVLVADDAGAAVGYVKLRNPSPLESNRHVFEINGIAVAPESRRRGVARALLRAVADEGRARGARKLRLRVLGDNAPARALYESEGWTVSGVLPGEFLLEGRYIDDVLMELDLTG